MARSYSIKEGFASPDKKWLVGKERSYKYKFFRTDGSVVEGESKFHGLLKEDGSPERVAKLTELMEKSAVSIPVFRGQPASETLDKKAMKEALKKNKEELDWRQKKRDLFYGGAGMFHFAAGVEHASNYSSEGGIVEGVLLAKNLLDLRELGSEPKGFRGSTWDSEKGVRVDHQDAVPKFSKPEPVEPPYEKRYVKGTGDGWMADRTKEYEDYIKNRDSWKKEKEKFLDNFYSKVNDGIYTVQYPSVDRKDYDSPKWGKSVDENVRVAKYIDSAVKTIADAYQSKFGKPMPQDIYLKKGQTVNANTKKLLERSDYAGLRQALWYDKRFSKGPYAYLLLQTTPFKEIVKKAGFDAIAYNDIIHHGDNHESFAVLDPKQFKAFAGDKPVNLKSDNMFDAD